MEMSLGTAEYANLLIKKLKVARQTVRDQKSGLTQHREADNAALRDVQTFAVGDLVLLHDPVVKPGRTRKLRSPWRGPFQVIECYPNLVNYKIHPLDKKGRLVDRGRSHIVHIGRLKPFILPATSAIRQAALISQE